MRKAIVSLAAIAALALFAAPAAAAEDSDSCDVTLTIEDYCHIEYGGTSFDITLSGGASGGSDVEGFHAGANFAAGISGVLTPPTGAPGDWSFDIDGQGQAVINFGPGEYNAGVGGTVTVTVENVGLADGADSWATGGTMEITVQATP